VSQLTDFFRTDITEEFVEYGIQPVSIVLCDRAGECLGYTISLNPVKDVIDNVEVMILHATVFRTYLFGEKLVSNEVFSAEINRRQISIYNTFLCGLHICGDFIKFNEKGIL